MVTFDTGTNFPAVRWSSLLALAIMFIRHRWNGTGVPTQSHPNAASVTLSAWNIQMEHMKKFWLFCSTFTTASACKQGEFPVAQDLKFSPKALNSWTNVRQFYLTKTACHTIRHFYEDFMIFQSHHRNKCQNNKISITNKSFVNVKKFKYLGTIVTSKTKLIKSG